jgi:hypothetical protein
VKKKKNMSVNVNVMVQCAAHRELLEVSQSVDSGRIILHAGPCETCWKMAMEQADAKYVKAVRGLAEQI